MMIILQDGISLNKPIAKTEYFKINSVISNSLFSLLKMIKKNNNKKNSNINLGDKFITPEAI